MNIEIRNLSKTYKDKNILSKLNIDIEDNSVFFILGESGIGKTTLIRILLGLEAVDGGTIEGIDHSKISAVFQEDILLENLTIKANLKLVNDSIDDEVIENLLLEIGVDSPIDTIVNNLSGGMKRRISILRALIVDFEVLIMDEPFKGLDESTKSRVMEFVIKNIEHKKTIIVTHDKNEIEYFKKKIKSKYIELTV